MTWLAAMGPATCAVLCCAALCCAALCCTEWQLCNGVLWLWLHGRAVVVQPPTCSEAHVHQLGILNDWDAAPVDRVHQHLAVQVRVAAQGGSGGEGDGKATQQAVNQAAGMAGGA